VPQLSPPSYAIPRRLSCGDFQSGGPETDFFCHRLVMLVPFFAYGDVHSFIHPLSGFLGSLVDAVVCYLSVKSSAVPFSPELSLTSPEFLRRLLTPFFPGDLPSARGYYLNPGHYRLHR